MIIKLSEAKMRTYTCHKCNKEIKIGDKYYKSDEKLTKKPFPTAVYCVNCGKPMFESQITK